MLIHISHRSIIIDHLGSISYNQIHKNAIAYIYCNYGEPDQTAFNILGSLLHQLILANPIFPDGIKKLYEANEEKKTRPRLDDYVQQLLSLCASFTRIYILVDALDELASRERDILLSALKQLTNVSFLMTSRHSWNIQAAFAANSQIEIRANDEDIKAFLRREIENSPNLQSLLQQPRKDSHYVASLIDDITSTIAGKAQGMCVILPAVPGFWPCLTHDLKVSSS